MERREAGRADRAWPVVVTDPAHTRRTGELDREIALTRPQCTGQFGAGRAIQRDRRRTHSGGEVRQVEFWLETEGRVGMWGISYMGFYASAGMIDSHPALRVVSPQAPIADWFWDDMHHHGAFVLSLSSLAVGAWLDVATVVCVSGSNGAGSTWPTLSVATL